jgi:hypothetical protein
MDTYSTRIPQELVVPTFGTTDLYFAAFLKTAGVPFLRTESEGTRMVFVFQNTDNAVRDLKKSYYARIPHKICALSYADEIRTLKTLTRS